MFSNVEEATLCTLNAVDMVGRGAAEYLFYMELSSPFVSIFHHTLSTNSPPHHASLIPS